MEGKIAHVSKRGPINLILIFSDFGLSLVHSTLLKEIAMPVFSQQPKETKKPGRPGIPQEIVDEYKQYVQELEKGSIGRLEFKQDEDITQARKALKEAGIQLKKQVKIRKPRGEDGVLLFERAARKRRAAAQKTAPRKESKPRARAKKKS